MLGASAEMLDGGLARQRKSDGQTTALSRTKAPTTVLPLGGV
jgi:hypothetical protein